MVSVRIPRKPGYNETKWQFWGTNQFRIRRFRVI